MSESMLPRSEVVPRNGRHRRLDGIDDPHARRTLELFALHRQIAEALALLPEGSPERLTALATLRDVRRVLARCEFAPG